MPDGERVRLFVGLGLISIGIAGHFVTIQRFIGQQVGDENNNSAYHKTVASANQRHEAYYIPNIAAFVAFNIYSWPVRFGISAICEMVATFWFLSGSLSYQHKKPRGSPITKFLRVLFASASKVFHPRDYNTMLYEKSSFNAYKLPRTPGLRWLERAAMILPNDTFNEPRRNKWRLCTVTQVEKTKIILRLLPAWLTMVVCGVVSSNSNSFFLEQAKNLNPLSLYKFQLNLPNMLLFCDFSKVVFGTLYMLFAVIFVKGGRRKYAAAIGVAIAMVFSILTCIIAARIESKRLGVISENDLVDKPEAFIPMSAGWLIFQYILNGAVYGIAAQSMYFVFYTQAPYSMRLILVRITNGFLGLGFIGSAALVDGVGKVSESRGGRNWFQRSSNQSRLDNYYWTLAVLSAANLLLCFLVPIGYRFRDFEKENKSNDNGKLEEEERDEDEDELMEDIAEDVFDAIVENLENDDDA